MFTQGASRLTLLAAVWAAACAPADQSGLYLSASTRTFDGRTEHSVLRVQAFAPTGAAGQGLVSFNAPAGTFSPSADVALVDGLALVSFSCDPQLDPACSGALRLSATWRGFSQPLTVTVLPSTQVEPVNFSAVSTNSVETLNGLALASDGVGLWAVGTNGAVLRYTTKTGWATQPQVTGADLHAVSVAPDDTPVVVGDEGTILVWHSPTFVPVDTKKPTERFLAVVASSASDAYVGSDTGAIYHYDGAVLSQVFTLSTSVCSLISDGTQLWAAGDGVLAVMDSSGAWTARTAPVLARYSVALFTAEGLWLAGPRLDVAGGVLLLGPSQWKATTLSDPITALAVVPGGDEHFALTATGLYRSVGSAAWAKLQVPSGGRAALSRGVGDLVVVGPPGFSLFRQ